MRDICIFNGGVKNSGGIERVAANLANMWVADGDKVTLVISDSCTESFFKLDPNIKITSLGVDHNISVLRQLVDFFRLIVKFRAYVKRKRPDVVMGMWTSRAMIATIACLGLGIPVIACEHSAYEKMRSDFKILRLFVYRLSTAVVALTERDTDLYKKINANSYTIPNAIKRIRYNERDDTNKTILWVGWISYEKGVDRLLEIWSEICKKYPDWKLKIIGKIPDDKPEYGKMLDRMKNKYEFGGQLTIMASTQEIFNEYDNADIFVMTSRYEGLPMVLLEAMASGLPVICYDCPTGPREIIEDRVNGFLISDGDTKSFAEKLSLLIENNALRKVYGKNAYDTVNRCFNEKIVSWKWDDLIARCISR